MTHSTPQPTDRSGYTKRDRSDYNAHYYQNNKERLKQRNKVHHEKFIAENPDYMRDYMAIYNKL